MDCGLGKEKGMRDSGVEIGEIIFPPRKKEGKVVM